MKERPILMHARSINGILKDWKSQTRRIVKFPKEIQNPNWTGYNRAIVDGSLRLYFPGSPCWTEHPPIHCPYGVVGDQLWVRETWALDPDAHPDEAGTLYRATDPGWDENDSGLKWKPSIFMPRDRSRITLEITDIRVEKVQDASIEDILAEGIRIPVNEKGHPLTQLTGLPEGSIPDWPKTEDEFLRYYWAILWEQTNGKGAWNRNDWVWALDFKRVEK